MVKQSWRWVKRVGYAVAVTLMGTSPAWANTGLIQDVKNVTEFFSYTPGLITYGGFGLGTVAIVYTGYMLHKKGEYEQQGRPVTVKHIAFPALASAALFGAPFLTGSVQKTFFNDTQGAKATVGTTSQSVNIP
ncbi:hypothetical protein [Acidithiobacillus caldus]|nr:hypothetical protein [Acidithiobacillus caldus]MBU2728584.1 hypothetical protein [Acidithiobacillus caldus]MBU2736015.1 hypothetical protein [Acidithiobacillus caldus ATCC 51756]MBU2746281.1 hypothetical protein [Acidithiobacillus caldus]MBU2779149.1 hypothetical protein [Acidithiobacillus caldus]